jgi:DNA-binding PadR family transcriptional regulator
MTPETDAAVRSLLPLKPIIFHILLALMNEERHGYSIVKAVEDRLGDGRRIEPGNLYRSLRTMLADGLIEESHTRPDPELDDQRRRYFRISPLGLRVARAEVVRLEELVAVARSHKLLSGSGGRG